MNFDLGKRMLIRDFDWRRGMQVVGEDCGRGTITDRRSGRVYIWWEDTEEASHPVVYSLSDMAGMSVVPDMDDPATQGCVEVILQEHCGGIFEVCYHVDGGWSVDVADRRSYGQTKGEALLKAFESMAGVRR